MPSIGLVEGLLILAENIPRDSGTPSKPSLLRRKHRVAKDRSIVSGDENRQAWMFIGLAIRMAYALGLDQVSRSRNDAIPDPMLERSRLAWTYCYLFDRQVSTRQGKAFWSRGPSICFQGYSNFLQVISSVFALAVSLF